MGLLLALLLAAPASHRAAAARAEALGHMQEAAQEYAAAFGDEHAPDLLYRLGVVQRKLKRYALAREAFRAYLREAPDGGLRDEVVRQLAKLEVLIEAESENYADPAPRPARRGPAGPPAAHPSSPATSPPLAMPSPPAASLPAAQPSPPAASLPATQPASPAAASPPAAQPSPPAAASLPATQPSPPAAASLPAAQPSPPAAPRAALSSEPVTAPAPLRTRAAPWLLGGAAAATAAGAYFWYDSSRLSRDLDARFAAGSLSAADRPAYTRAHSEVVASRVLFVAAAALAAGAVALWW